MTSNPKLLQFLNLFFSNQSVLNLLNDLSEDQSANDVLNRFIYELTNGKKNLLRADGGNLDDTTLKFLQKSRRRINQEAQEADSDNALSSIIENSLKRMQSGWRPESLEDIADMLWPIFFPEGRSLLNEDQQTAEISRLRKKRVVQLSGVKSGKRNIETPVRQVLMTSNILVTLPMNFEESGLSSEMRDQLKSVQQEEQKYWYDHPIPLGVSPRSNELLYGLNGLNDMMAFEKARGKAPGDARLVCALSASTTHDGLHSLVHPWVEEEIRKNGMFDHLDIFIFTEQDAEEIIDEIFLPLIQKYYPDSEIDGLRQVFGVDGEYGRHYSFLKAISAFWQVFVDSRVDATFKVDLDQVFPQEEILHTTGKTALQLLAESNWGAMGTDHQGQPVELGMIAGALVNYDDIEEGLFTPDVTFPAAGISGREETVFFSRLPQAQSTQSEMMTRYGENKNQVIQRIHVTGGTNGILVDSLFKYRPFTPTFLGRAEDQAYLLSVLFNQDSHLRYLHQPGLIMRHDKKAFAMDAIDAAQTGKWTGDYIRTILFSYYAQTLPWDVNRIKSETAPFTGCFISKLPFTLVYLRWIFKILDLNHSGESRKAGELMQMGADRLDELMSTLEESPDYLKNIYLQEKSGWDLYYDLLIMAKKQLNSGDPFLMDISKKAEKIIQQFKI